MPRLAAIWGLETASLTHFPTHCLKCLLLSDVGYSSCRHGVRFSFSEYIRASPGIVPLGHRCAQEIPGSSVDTDNFAACRQTQASLAGPPLPRPVHARAG